MCAHAWQYVRLKGCMSDTVVSSKTLTLTHVHIQLPVQLQALPHAEILGQHCDSWPYQGWTGGGVQTMTRSKDNEGWSNTEGGECQHHIFYFYFYFKWKFQFVRETQSCSPDEFPSFSEEEFKTESIRFFSAEQQNLIWTLVSTQ